MIRVVKFKQTCSACPSQWEGVTDDDRGVYARFRHGHLTVQVAPVGGGTWAAATDGETVIDRTLSDGLDGVLDLEGLRKACAGKVEWA